MTTNTTRSFDFEIAVKEALVMSTKQTTEEAIRNLLAAGMADDGSRSDVTWDQLTAVSGIGYSRGWLILDRAIMAIKEPGAFVRTDQVVAEARERYEAAKAKAVKEGVELEPFSGEQAIADEVRRMIDVAGDSWGRAMVRLGMGESTVRKFYRAGSGLSDLGRRNGRGGRWLKDDPTLYSAHRKTEGAAFDAGTKRVEMTAEHAVNAEQRKAEVRPEVKEERPYVQRLEATIAEARAARLAAQKAKRATKASPKA